MYPSSAKKFYSIILLVVINAGAYAQITRKIELGLNAIAFVYQGDLTPSRIGSYKTMSLGLGVFANYKLNPLFSLKTALAHGRLKGDDSKFDHPAWRQQRNFKFTTPVTEISESVLWNIVPGRKLTPYLSAGIGYAFLNIKRDYSNFNPAYFAEDGTITQGLATDISHSLPKGLLVFPVGAGARFAVSNTISLNAESAYRFNSSDYLDGFSQGANPDKKDHFFTHSLGLIFSFGKKLGGLNCPVL